MSAAQLYRARRAATHLSLAVAVQCIALDDSKTGSRKVAGTHWDFNSYGGELKKAMGIAPQARAFLMLCLAHALCHAVLADGYGFRRLATVLCSTSRGTWCACGVAPWLVSRQFRNVRQRERSA